MDSLSDIALLRQWRDRRDAHAFNILAQRYGGLVFGICNRVLKNGADAEEVTQECFLKLATHSRPPERSLGPWLHSVAVRSSLNFLRSETRRRHREERFAATQSADDRVGARKVIEHVDEAISALPDELRHCLVAAFLEGKSQGEVAEELELSPRTIRRKTDEAIEGVRRILAERGVMTGTGALGIMLAGLRAEAVPPALGMALGKLAVSGSSATGQQAPGAVAERATFKGGTFTMKHLIWAVAGMAIVAGSFSWGNRDRGTTGEGRGNTIVLAQRTEAPTPAPEAITPETETPPATVVRSEESPHSAPPPALRTIADILPIAQPTDYASLSGVVEDMAGQPIPGATVSALVAGVTLEETAGLSLEGYPEPTEGMAGAIFSERPHRVLERAFATPGHQFRAQSGAGGGFLLRDIPYYGETRMLAEADGYAPEMQRTQLTAAPHSEVHFALRSARPLRGRIVTPTGTGVVDGRVAVTGTRNQHGGGSSSSSPLPESFWARTDHEGYFTLWIADAEWATVIVRSERYGKGAFYDVPVGSEAPVTLALTSHMGALEGHLVLATTQPASGYYVHLAGALHDTASDSESSPQFPLDGSRFEIQTDSEGRFEIAPIPTNEEFKAAIYDATGKKVGDASVPVLLPKTLTPWTHRLEAPTRITGRVIARKSGKGMANVLVRGMRAADLGHRGLTIDSTTTAEDGSFTLALYSGDGEYLVQATTDPHAGVTHDPTLYESVVVKRGKPPHVTIQLAETWSRRFLVVDPHGNPVPEATVRLNQMGPQGGSQRHLRGVSTDETGLFTYEQLAGDAKSVFTFQKAGFLDTESVALSAPDVEHTVEEIITLYPAATVTLRALTGSGAPLSDTELLATVYLPDGTVRSIDVTSDADGWIILRDWLPATVIDLSLRLPGNDTADGQKMFMGGSGAPTVAMRERMAALAVKTAAAQNTPSALLEGVALQAAMETELGDVWLQTPSKGVTSQ